MESRCIRLKRLRENLGLSCMDISNFLNVDLQDIISHENDSGKLNLTILNKLADLYCCDEKYLLCLTDNCEEIEYAFKSGDISVIDLDALAKINQIYKNTKYLLEKESEMGSTNEIA